MPNCSLGQTGTWCVYMHTNILNGKIYIGITGRPPEQRWENGHGYRGGAFRAAINKYGWDGFTHQVLCAGLTEREAKQLETAYIHKFKSNEREHGYNLTNGGDGVCGLKHTDQTREKMRNSHIGHTHSTETKQKISNASLGNTKWLGKQHTAETKTKMSDSRRKYYETNPVSECERELRAQRAKAAYDNNPKLRETISARRKQYFRDNPNAASEVSQRLKEYYRNHPDAAQKLAVGRRKPVDMLDASGVVIHTFECMTVAQEISGVNRSSIARSCAGKQKTAGGYAWRYHID